MSKYRYRIIQISGKVLKALCLTELCLFWPFLRWLVGTKHSPESKTHLRIQKHVPESKTRSRIQKHVLVWQVFWILGRVFGVWEVFLDSGKCFVPTSHGTFQLNADSPLSMLHLWLLNASFFNFCPVYWSAHHNLGYSCFRLFICHETVKRIK